ncbi:POLYGALACTURONASE [Salix koriyanagi]|uniref:POLYGALACTURONASE n=1 Tax=Salix koriyanagi TaxID=2511006 RepID=A0A9Q0UN69_9ROSI|nr:POLYGALACTURONASE [Salix koriyanagi]
MGFMKVNVSAIFLLMFLASRSDVKAENVVFDVTKYGNEEDICKAFKRAWEDACASTSPSTVLIPKGTFLLGPVIISGPCKAAIELQVKGKLQAPADMSEFQGFSSWITLNYVDQFTLTGGGTFDGQGKLESNQRICGKDKHCKLPPVSLKFNFITNGIVHDITSTDSKYFHAHLLGCKNLTFQHFTISAHDESLNTDGIHIGRSKNIKIIDSDIGTGDDCISLGHGSRQITIAGVTCAPGHGISIGSLGKSQNEESVSGVFVKNCTISNTQNGVRIKSWPALFGGSASDIHFEDIIMKNVSNPIVIDQVYCPWNECNKKSPSKVSIRNVSFKNIRGTSRTPVAVQLSCSKDIPCKDVEVADIDLRYTGNEGPAEFRCSNVQPKFLGKINPSKC